MVVEVHIAHQRLLHIFTAYEVVGLEDVGNPSIESFDHAVGLR